MTDSASPHLSLVPPLTSDARTVESDKSVGDDAGWNELVLGLPEGCDEWVAEELAALLADRAIPSTEGPDAPLGGVEIRTAARPGATATLGAPEGAQHALVVYCREGQLAAIVAAVELLVGHLLPDAPSRSIAVTRRPLAAGWRERWKEFFTVQRLGHVVVRPSWRPYAPAPEEVVVVLDPGHAFGTGTHASTRLVLNILGDWPRCLVPKDRDPPPAAADPRRVLDLGCGSGILAVAALSLWPNAAAVGLDVESEALRVAGENSQLNGVADRLVVGEAPLGDAHGRFDLVLANIQADVLRALVEPIAAAMAKGGTLVLSGLLDAEAPELARLYRARLASRDVVLRSEDGWTAVILSGCHGAGT
jgi:ribosomal protein L11 methyltransferase